MSDLVEPAPKVNVISITDLGPENQGGFGPSSEIEEAAITNVTKPNYVAQPTIETHCMDDGFEGAACQLPGGLLITEIAGDYMDPDAGVLALDQMADIKTDSILKRGRPVIVHGDTKHGEGGCAANSLLRNALVYNALHEEIIVPQAWKRMEIMGLDSYLQKGDIRQAIYTGRRRAEDADLWRGIDAATVVQVACASGAEYEEFDREHNIACSRTDVSENVFNNGAFRVEHQTDGGEPMGVFSITLGAYKDQLLEDGFEEPEIAKKLMHTILFSLGILKMATKEGVKDVIVG